MAQPPTMMPGQPAAPDPDAGAPMDDGPSDTPVVTISKADDGSYVVYAGDEPDADSDGGDDASAAPPQGQPADSIGAALKIALQIMTADKSSEGAPGNADDQFQSGFDGTATPAGNS